MLSQILDFLRSIGTAILPWCVVDHWQEAVILRFGVFNRVLPPGFHFKLPFAEQAILQSVVPTTTALRPQSVVTKDGRIVTTEAVVRWSVSDVKAFTVDIWDGQNVIIDITQGAIADAVRSLDFDAGNLTRRITSESRKALSNYGITVEAVTLTTLAPVRVVRLIGATPHPNDNQNQTA